MVIGLSVFGWMRVGGYCSLVADRPANLASIALLSQITDNTCSVFDRSIVAEGSKSC